MFWTEVTTIFPDPVLACVINLSQLLCKREIMGANVLVCISAYVFGWVPWRTGVRRITIQEWKCLKINQSCRSRQLMPLIQSILQSHQTLIQNAAPSHACHHGLWTASRQNSRSMKQVVPILERNCDAWKHCNRSCWTQSCVMSYFFFKTKSYKTIKKNNLTVSASSRKLQPTLSLHEWQ